MQGSGAVGGRVNTGGRGFGSEGNEEKGLWNDGWAGEGAWTNIVLMKEVMSLARRARIEALCRSVRSGYCGLGLR